MKKIILLSILSIIALNQVSAKIWRVSNVSGVAADYNNLQSAVSASLVQSGDTVHLEPSPNYYAGFNLNKSLVFIGSGYFVSGAGSNAGLQENPNTSIIASSNVILQSGSAGSKFIGISFYSCSPYPASGYSGNLNLLIEKCYFNNAYLIGTNANDTYSNVTVRKCFTSYGFYILSNVTLNNFTVENTICNNNFQFNTSIGSNNNLFRNNVVWGSITAVKCYVANNIIAAPSTFDNCVVSNNVFTTNQTGVTVGPLSTNGNNLINVLWTDVFTATGSSDAYWQLKTGSPALGGGVDISGYKPDCGAFGGPDAYKLSGIPGIPTIYGFSAPSSIPVGTPSMNATISTRNNN